MSNLICILAIILSTTFFPSKNLSIPQSFSNSFLSSKEIGLKSLGIKTTAQSVLVIEKDSGKIVFEKNKDTVFPIASLTKLMTALVFLEKDKGDWTRFIEIKEEDLAEASKIGFKVGDKVKVYDLFYSALIKSANDATKALVRTAIIDDHKNFIDLMNEEAKKLGMEKTNFVEPTGLNPANQSTAIDLAKLIQAAFNRPEILNALQKPSYTLKIQKSNGQQILRKIYNTNKLLNTYNIVGAKTGYLKEAGYCYAGIFKIEKKDFIIIILGSNTDQDRYQEVKGLIWWVKERFLKQ